MHVRSVTIEGVCLHLTCRQERRVSTQPAPSAASVDWVLVRERTCASVAMTSGIWTATELEPTWGQVSKAEKDTLRHALVYVCGDLMWNVLHADSETSSEGSRSRSRTQSLTSPSPTSSGILHYSYVARDEQYWELVSDNVLLYRTTFFQDPNVKGEQCWRASHQGSGKF